MELRQFVLTPLADIAAEINASTIAEKHRRTAAKCEDDSNLSLWDES